MSRGPLPRIAISAAMLVLGAGCAAAPADDVPARAAIAVGAMTPLYEAQALTGDTVRVGADAGALTLLNVWATWCASCREEMRDLEAIHNDYRARGLAVVAVSVDAGSERLVRRVAQAESVSFQVVHDQAGRIQSVFHVMGVPANYLIGRDGTLVWQQVGGVHGTTERVRAAIDSALAHGDAR